MSLWKIAFPQEVTNQVYNPSSELVVMDSYGAPGAIARSNAWSKFGGWSTLCTSTATTNGVLIRFSSSATTIALTGGVKYHLSAWVKGLGYLGGASLRMAIENTVGGAELAAATTTATVDTELYLDYTPGLTTTVRVVFTSSAAANVQFYVDGVQLFASGRTGYRWTYCDGDQSGCFWKGTPHAAKSGRSSQARQGGYYEDFETIGLTVRQVDGTGMAPLQQFIQPMTLVDGERHAGARALPHDFILVGDIIGSSLADLHYKRVKIINALKPDKVTGNQNCVIRYTGGEEPVNASARYMGGLEYNGGARDGFTETVAIRMRISEDPYWYTDGDRAQHLTTVNTFTAKYIAQKYQGAWGAMGSGLNGVVRSFSENNNGDLFVGGAFTASGATTLNGIGKWSYNSQAWSALGTGVSGGTTDVYATAIEPANQTPWIGGNFTAANGVAASNIAWWNGTTFAALGAGVNNTVYGMAYRTGIGLYVVGQFTTAGGAASNYAALWTGAPGWTALSGMATFGSCVDVGPDGLIYAGDFNGNLYSLTPGSTSFTTLWSSTNGEAIIDILPVERGIYVMTGLDPDTTLRRWNGTAMQTLGTGAGNTINELGEVVRLRDGNIMFGGGFNSWTGPITTNGDGLALWNGASFQNVDVDLPFGAANSICAIYASNVRDYDTTNGEEYPQTLYVGCSSTGTATSSYTTLLDVVSATVPNTRGISPIIKFYRSGGTSLTLQWLRNETTGKTLYLQDYAMSDGEYISIDTNPLETRILSSVHGDVTGRALRRGSDFSTFELLPGKNQISIKATQAGSPTVEAFMLWKLRQWSFDGAQTS